MLWCLVPLIRPSRIDEHQWHNGSGSGVQWRTRNAHCNALVFSAAAGRNPQRLVGALRHLERREAKAVIMSARMWSCGRSVGRRITGPWDDFPTTILPDRFHSQASPRTPRVCAGRSREIVVAAAQTSAGDFTVSKLFRSRRQLEKPDADPPTPRNYSRRRGEEEEQESAKWNAHTRCEFPGRPCSPGVDLHKARFHALCY